MEGVHVSKCSTGVIWLERCTAVVTFGDILSFFNIKYPATDILQSLFGDVFYA